MDIKVTKCAISELMPIEGKGSYNIPEYQRNYSWSEDNIETLIQDIINEDDGYYLGNIIITSKSDSEDTYDIVDGQQRFTTITLILFETKYEKKTKRYYLCYNISGKFFKLSKIKRQSVVADLTLFDYYKVGAIEVFYR